MFHRRVAAAAALSFLIQGAPIFATNPGLPLVTTGPIRIELEAAATSLNASLDFMSANNGSGRLFIMQQTGKILILMNGSVSPTPFLDVGSRLVTLKSGYDAFHRMQLQATGPAPSSDAAAAILMPALTPGPYTAIVSGVGHTKGVALVEVYQLN